MPAADVAFYEELKASFPWLANIGLSPTWLQDTIASSTGAAEIVSKIRETPQYKLRFPGLRRPDGSIRMTEAEYIRTEEGYRQLLRQYGHEVDDGDPASLSGFFAADLDANELKARLDVYKGVVESGTQVKNAFYVYAGMSVSDEDLYRAAVDPKGYGRELTEQYNSKTTLSPLDYQTWITRATEVGLQNVVSKLSELQGSGQLTSTAVQQIRALNPDFARQMMDVLHSDGGQQSQLSLTELLQAFEFAAIGGAATGAGLTMPTRERLQEIRAMGVERARAIEGYQNFGKNSAQYNAAVLRARGQAFTQNDFESAAFLGDATQVRNLEAGLAGEAAAGKHQGTFRFDEAPGGGFVQKGFERKF